MTDLNDFGHFLEGKIIAPPIILIVTGAVIFLIASLGCYGAIRESPMLLLLVNRFIQNQLQIVEMLALPIQVCRLAEHCVRH